MTVQRIPPTIGAVGVIEAVAGYESKLPPGTAVTVIEVEKGNPWVRVRSNDEAAIEEKLGHWQVDCGKLYEARKGVWLPESAPEVLDWFEAAYRARLGQPMERGIHGKIEDLMRDQRALLRRNGRKA